MADRTQVVAEINVKAYRDGNDFAVTGNIDGSIVDLATALTDIALDFPNFDSALNLAILQIREEKAKAAQG